LLQREGATSNNSLGAPMLRGKRMERE
jgi:hypothetical protein